MVPFFFPTLIHPPVLLSTANACEANMRLTVYEVGPRDGLQNLPEFVPTDVKRRLISELYKSGIEHIEEVSFVHPKRVPQMADAEDVYAYGAALVMNPKGMERALASGVKLFNVVFSPCETFNINNMGRTRTELVYMFKSMLQDIPKENVRVYISMAFGSPYSGEIPPHLLKQCVRDASMLGSTVVFADTIGIADREDIEIAAEYAREYSLTSALHLHHNEHEEQLALDRVRYGIFAGITQFDSSIGGLGGCPFVEGSGGNLATERLVQYLNDHAFDVGLTVDDLQGALVWADKVKALQSSVVTA
jgi:hydroxymethylglutaryl-CoA lyase